MQQVDSVKEMDVIGLGMCVRVRNVCVPKVALENSSVPWYCTKCML